MKDLKILIEYKKEQIFASKRERILRQTKSKNHK